MNSFDVKKVKELFARLFVLAIQNKINFSAFTKSLERSELVNNIEKNQYSDYFNNSLENIFFDVTNRRIEVDDSFGIYNDAYWCGYSYFELFQSTKKPFSFLFLKLPLSKLINIYSIYHEMDFSSLLDYFYRLDREKTVLRLLCEEKKCSITKLSIETGIGKAALSKYNASDDNLFKASFQAIYKIASFFDVPLSLFYKVS